MFNPIIETAIGLIFVYLLLSMICSAVQEWIAALFALRPSTLFKGIRMMVCGDDALFNKIIKNPLIDGLSHRTIWDKLFLRPARPSYITAETFSQAFLKEAKLTLDKINALKTAPAARTPAQAALITETDRTLELLTSLVADAPADVDSVRKNIEGWYNDAMGRVSGWYKRKTHFIILAIGLAIAVAFNADTLMLIRAFWADPVLRANTAAAAEQWIKDHPNGPEQSTTATETRSSPAGGAESKPSVPAKPNQPDIADNYPSTTSVSPAEPVSETPAPSEQPYSPEQVERAEQQYRDATAKLKSTTEEVTGQLSALNVPFGWCSGPEQKDVAEETSVDPTTTTEDETVPEQSEAQAADPREGESVAFAEKPERGSPASFMRARGVCDPDHQLPRGSAWWLKISGLLITMLALSQGAPFWFDLLKKVTNLRLAGASPDEKKN